MKICVYGAGAVGGHIAGRLAAGGAEVSVIARGAQLAAIRADGLRVQTREGILTSRPAATDDPTDLDLQDIVIVAVKGPTLPAIAANIAALLHEQSLVMFVLNGIPWWYFQHHGGPLDATPLPRLDPDGDLERHIGSDRVVGAVAYTAGTVIAPGVIRAENPRNRLVIGRPDGRADGRLDAFAALLAPSGLEVDVTSSIRNAIWVKLVSNLIGGSLGVLAASPMNAVLDQPAVLRTATAMADECVAVARALGCEPGDPAATLAKLATSHHLQSIAQDLMVGRPMEIDAIMRVPLDLAKLVGVETTQLDLIVGLATQRARAAGLYRGIEEG